MNAATSTIGDNDWKARPMPPGIEDRSGMSSLARCGPPGSDWVDCPLKKAYERKRASPTATRLMTTPDTMWSTRNVIVATAWTPAKMAPHSAPNSSPRMGPHGSPSSSVSVKKRAPNAPVTVPMIMSPSRPMFTIPERSLNSPPRPVR
jgi:hypothetical protein